MRYDRIKNIIQLQWCNDLEEILQCPVCFERPVKPIYQCNFGHHICSVCRGQITICPMCQKTYNGSRSYLAEDLTLKLDEIKVRELFILDFNSIYLVKSYF